MTQFNTPPAPLPHGAVPPIPAKTSALAIVSLVFSLLICLPFLAPAIGLLTGVLACALIARSAGRAKGMALAVAGICLSVLVFLGDVAISAFGLRFMNQTAQVVEQFIADVEGGDFASARTSLTPETKALVTDTDLRDLQHLLKDEYGTIRSSGFDWSFTAAKAGLTAPVASRPAGTTSGPSPQTGRGKRATGMAMYGGTDLPVRLVFSRKTVSGIASLHASASGGGPPTFLLDSFTLIGDVGPWSFPFGPNPEEEEHDESDEHDHDHDHDHDSESSP